jgi:hypothetical protein
MKRSRSFQPVGPDSPTARDHFVEIWLMADTRIRILGKWTNNGNWKNPNGGRQIKTRWHTSWQAAIEQWSERAKGFPPCGWKIIQSCEYHDQHCSQCRMARKLLGIERTLNRDERVCSEPSLSEPKSSGSPRVRVVLGADT